MDQRLQDTTDLLAFLIFLAEEKGEGETWGGRRLGDVIQATCRLLNIDPVAARAAILHPEGVVN